MAIQINDKVVLDLTDDDDLRDYFSSKNAGEECVMEIKGSVSRINGKN